jgi:hypothetical protein
VRGVPTFMPIWRETRGNGKRISRSAWIERFPGFGATALQIFSASAGGASCRRDDDSTGNLFEDAREETLYVSEEAAALRFGFFFFVFVRRRRSLDHRIDMNRNFC